MRSKLGVIFLLYSLISYSQESEIKVYHWEELPISYNADSIIGLSFSKMKLTSFKVDLAQFRNLKVLDLSKNKLSELPIGLDSLLFLKEINLGKNEFQGFPIGLCKLETIERLILNKNNIEIIPSCIGYLFNLKYIDLLDNPITQLPIELMNLKYLQEIDFTGIRFSPEFQEIWLERMPKVNLIFDAPCDCMK